MRDKVAIGTYHVVFVILNFVSAIESICILQLLNGISKDLQKLLKYFSGTAIFTFLNTILLSTVIDSPMKLDLYVKDVELTVETLSGFSAFFTRDSSLLNCYKFPEVSE